MGVGTLRILYRSFGNEYTYNNPEFWKPYFTRQAYRLKLKSLGINLNTYTQPNFRNLSCYSSNGEERYDPSKFTEVNTPMPIEMLGGYETGGAITPEDLFANLSQSVQNKLSLLRKPSHMYLAKNGLTIF